MLQAVKKRAEKIIIRSGVSGHVAKENGVHSARGLRKALFKFKYLREKRFLRLLEH